MNYGRLPEDYETDVLASKMVDFIQRNSGDGPFFMYAAPGAPHLPAKPAPRHEDGFEGVTAPRVPSFNEEDVSDKPAWVHSLPLLGPDDMETIDDIYRKRLQSMLSVGDMVAMILAALESVDELDQTYIIFTSDNGFSVGEHRRILGKGTAYDESIRVPLIIRGPGISGGQVLKDIVLNNDLAPTVAELAGVPVSDFVDGRSLVPLLNGKTPAAGWRVGFLIGHWARRSANGGGLPEYAAVRTPDYLYVEYVTGERELYDLRSDPYQLESLHATAEPELIFGLAAWLDELRNCVGEGCRKTESSPPR